LSVGLSACRSPAHDLLRSEDVVAIDRLRPAQVAQLVEDIDAVGVSALVVVDGRQLDLRDPREAGDDLADVEAVVAGERKVVDRGRGPVGGGAVPSLAVQGILDAGSSRPVEAPW
jgi:hypothetical protein